MDNKEFIISANDNHWIIVDQRNYVPFTLMPLGGRVYLVSNLEEVIPFVANRTGCEVRLEDDLDESIDIKKIVVYKKGAGNSAIEYGFCQPAYHFLQRVLPNDSMKPSFSLRATDDFEGDVMNEIPIENC